MIRTGVMTNRNTSRRQLPQREIGLVTTKTRLSVPRIVHQSLGGASQEVPCCVSAAICSGFEILLQGSFDEELSMIYHFRHASRGQMRAMQTNQGLNTARIQGVCCFSKHPYRALPENVRIPTSNEANLDGKKQRLSFGSKGSASLNKANLAIWKSELAMGHPILLVFSLTASAYKKVKTAPYIHGLTPGEDFVTNHAVLIVGFDNQKELFSILDCQGAMFAENGFWHLSYETARLSSFTVEPPVALRHITLKRR